LFTYLLTYVCKNEVKSLQNEAAVDPLILCGSAVATLWGTAAAMLLGTDTAPAAAVAVVGGEAGIGFS